MNPSDFGDPLTFPVAPPAGPNLHLSREISLHLPDGLAPNFGYELRILVLILILHLGPSSGQKIPNLFTGELRNTCKTDISTSLSHTLSLDVSSKC